MSFWEEWSHLENLSRNIPGKIVCLFLKIENKIKLKQKIEVATFCYIREYGSTLYVGLACAVSPTNTNFRLTFLLTGPQEALYEDLAV